MNDITEVEFPIQLEDIPVKIFKLIRKGDSVYHIRKPQCYC